MNGNTTYPVMGPIHYRKRQLDYFKKSKNIKKTAILKCTEAEFK